jgi:hypothetical protein
MMRSPGMITGMPGGYGMICSAATRPIASRAATVSRGSRRQTRP